MENLPNEMNKPEEKEEKEEKTNKHKIIDEEVHIESDEESNGIGYELINIRPV